jgi:hypothetical protein
MSSSGANPFTCDMTIEGRACGGVVAFLYRTATATRLICDHCAAGLRTAKGRIVPAPIVEFHLLELAPARASLLSELRFAKETIDGNKAHIAYLQAVLDVYERIPLLRRIMAGAVKKATGVK